jgi:alcohol dehydrogenase
MQSLTYVKPGLVEWQDVPEPKLEGDGQALVRPVCATTCEIDQQLIHGGTPLQPPFPIGHECIAEIVDLGDGVEGFEPGQLVVLPWHIACGECARCRTGQTAHCELVPRGAVYGFPLAGQWGGMFDDIVHVPYAAGMLFHVPPDLEFESVVGASGHPNLAIEVIEGHLREYPQARVLVLGRRSMGVYAVDVAVALGASEVVYADTTPERIEFAKRLGAKTVNGLPQREELGEFDVCIDCRLDPDWLRAALVMLTPEGVLESVGPYYGDVPFPLLEMYLRGVRYRINRGNVGAYLPRLLELVQEDRVHPEMMITETLPWDDAPRAVLDLPSAKPMFVREASG